MTTKHEIEIPDLPDGYRLVRVNIKQNDRYRNDDGTSTIAGCDLIVEKIKPRRIVLEETDEPNSNVDMQELSVPGTSIQLKHSRKYWRVVEEE